MEGNLGARLFSCSKGYVTLTLWRDEGALTKFIRSRNHLDAMKNASGILSSGVFSRFATSTESIESISNEEALAALDLDSAKLRNYS